MGEEDLIKSGISIMIRRTDGRTHPAIVSSVNDAARSVTVEWFENGETKGKEVDFDAVYALNHQLVPGNNTSKNINNQVEESHGAQLSRNGTRASLAGKVNARISQLSNGNFEARKEAIENVRHTLQPLNNKGMALTTSPSDSSLNSKRISKVKSYTEQQPVGSGVTVPVKPTRNSLVPTIANNVVKNPEPVAPAGTGPGAARAPKRSNVVKEVEKLKKNREERRQRQAEKKEEMEILRNVDAGNPNWQFLAMIRDYQATLDLNPLRGLDPVETHQITVCVRKRPLSKKEVNRKEVDVITIPRKDTVIVHEPKTKVDLTKFLENQPFRFDFTFDETCSNELVYKYTAQPLVQTIFEGGMATCFAYGQTGSGKTHTMGGTFSGKMQDCKRGIYAMAAKDVFKLWQSPQYRNKHLVITSSFFEIYSGKVFDLLADKAKLRVLEDGKQQVQVVGLTEKVVNSEEEVLSLLQAGNQARTSGQTSVNVNSSRSHAVFQITLRVPNTHKVHGKFSLIDLAGNERGADTSSSDRLTRMEGAEINKSLLALKECIRALGRKGSHLPFRASKLTQVLRDSFIGDNSKTCMIAMISPGMSSCEHSLNTLRYADRVKELVATDTAASSQTASETEDQENFDLAALRSLNEKELSADLFYFHETLDQLQKVEEEMLDTFKSWRDIAPNLENDEKTLLGMTRNVDYDQEAFATGLERVLDEREKWLHQLREQVQGFRKLLVTEEEMSKRMSYP